MQSLLDKVMAYKQNANSVRIVAWVKLTQATFSDIYDGRKLKISNLKKSELKPSRQYAIVHFGWICALNRDTTNYVDA